jgi:hypothetical protein
MTEIMTVQSQILVAEGVQVGPLGATIEENITFEAFEEGLRNCHLLASASLWSLGDLLAYGEGRGDWGESYTQAISLAQRSYWTLTQAVRLAKAYPPGERVANISWSHHRDVAAIKDPAERRQLLEEAVKHHWSREELRAQRTKFEGDPLVKVFASTTCPKCGYNWPTS